jgi:flavin reductase (DIM6/NTAB) family NADH-FMN oxidoreductase RutF
MILACATRDGLATATGRRSRAPDLRGHSERTMSQDCQSTVTEALGQIPSGLFILTAAYGDVRSGVLTRWVQPCSISPPHVMVAVERGLPIEPLIRDSRMFALCQLCAGDRLLIRNFSAPPERGEDPFLTLPSHTSRGGSPIINRALSFLDCELVRHIVLDADHRLYVGLVHDGGVLRADCEPAVQIGGNGQVTGDHGSNGTNGFKPRENPPSRER